MLKKAGIVVLGATAGMLSLAPLASAGEAPSHGGDHGHHGEHHGGGNHHGPRGNDCSTDADATVLNVSDVLCNPEVGPVNGGGTQNNPGGSQGDDEGTGGGGGSEAGEDDGAAPAVNVSNVANNLDVDPINALGTQNN